MVARILITSISACGLAVLQSTILGKLLPVVPDIAMLILVVLAVRYGSIPGEISGFFVGLSIDAIGLAPFGFHAFIFVLIGYLSGKIGSNFSFRPVFLPIMIAALATLVKYISAILLSFFFGLNSGSMRYFSPRTILELLANIALAPLIFWVIFSIYEGIDRGKRAQN